LAKLKITDRAGRDLERVTDFLLETNVSAAVETTDLIVDALSILKRHPLIGRSIEYGFRELIVSRGRSGYVALYKYDETNDLVLVLAIRHQRESGYWSQIY